MLFRKAAIILTVLLVLATFGLAVWFWKSHNRLYSSPTAARTNANSLYTRLHAPAAKVPPFTTNSFASVNIERTTNRIVVSVAEALGSPGSPTDLDYEPLTIHRADASQTIRIGEGSIRLEAIGVARAQPVTNFDQGLQVPAKYFKPDGEPTTMEPKLMPEYMKTLSFDGGFPASQFVFIHSNIANLKTLKFHAFDARTQWQLSSGYSSSEFKNGFYYGTTLQLWHQTPVELVATVAAGPVETYTIPAEEGAVLEYPEGRLHLLLVSGENLGGWSSRHDGRTNTMTFNLGRRSGYSANRKTTSFLFHSWPQGWSMPIDIEFVDLNGKTIRGLGSGSSGYFLTARAEAEIDQIKEVRVKYYRNKHRLIYTIPELPGLPEGNRNIENLFDVQIPYAYFHYEYDYQNAIQNSLQMSSAHFPLNFPNGFFPTYRTDTTPEELFLEMEKLLSNPEQQLLADPAKNEIRTRPHPVRAAIDAIKKKLGM